MIDWLLTALLPISLLLTALLLIRSLVLKYLGSTISYVSWLLVPLSVLMITVNWQSLFPSAPLQGGFTRFITLPSQQLSQLQLTDIAQAVWLTGTAVLVIFALIGYWRAKQNLLMQSVPYAASTDDLPQGFSKTTLAIRQTEQNISPLLIGILSPVLIVPNQFDQLFSKEQQRLIFAHEFCHFKRGDMIWNTLALALLAVLWFHPLAWLAFIKFRQDQELSCDNFVLARKHRSSRINYGKALLVAAEQPSPMAFAQLSFKKYGDKHQMLERINQLKQPVTASRLGKGIAALCASLVLVTASFAGHVDKEGHKGKKATLAKQDYVMPVIRIEPKYPIKAAEQRIEGSVVLKFDITPKGAVDNVSVVKAVPQKIFDKVSKVALRQWKYEASPKGSKNNLVQLDFAMDENSQFEQYVEQIKVNN